PRLMENKRHDPTGAEGFQLNWYMPFPSICQPELPAATVVRLLSTALVAQVLAGAFATLSTTLWIVPAAVLVTRSRLFTVGLPGQPTVNFNGTACFELMLFTTGVFPDPGLSTGAAKPTTLNLSTEVTLSTQKFGTNSELKC